MKITISDTANLTAAPGRHLAGQLERHETPDPVRSNAMESRFQGVRAAGRQTPPWA